MLFSSLPPGFVANQAALSVRVTPASVKLKPVRAPPSAPAKVALSTAICAAIWVAVREPVEPSVMTWN